MARITKTRPHFFKAKFWGGPNSDSDIVGCSRKLVNGGVDDFCVVPIDLVLYIHRECQ